MPEIKNTFTGGKMNKDLDERLIPKGQYRNALNIQVRTSDGETEGIGDSGTVQNLQGNTLIGSSYYEDWMSEGLSNKPEDSLLPKCVGSVVDEKNDKAYFLFASTLKPPAWDMPHGEIEERVYVDTIIEQGLGGVNKAVVVDVFGIVDSFYNVLPGSQEDWNSSFPQGNVINNTGGWSEFTVLDGNKYRPGMTIDIRNSSGESILTEESGLLKIKAIDGNRIMLYEKCKINIVSDGGKWFVFKAPRVLSFNPSNFLSETSYINNYITGINIIDGLLFWTDSYSEPKKININRCKAGTNINGVANDLRTHTKLFVEHPVDKNLVDVATLDYQLDGGGNENGSGTNSYLQEKHITTIRKAPTTALSLQMDDGIRPGTTVDGIEYTFPIINDEIMEVGNSFSITSNAFLATQYFPNDVLTITENNQNAGAPVLIRAKFLGYEENIPGGTTLIGNSGVRFSRTPTDIIRIQILTPDSTEESSNNWKFQLEVKNKPLFELKLARFGYRYKYVDGEYSAFSPWSEVAFLPSNYKFKAKDGYNLGMTNTVRNLIIKDFIPYKRPLDLAAVEILYKTTDSASVYVVDTIEKEKSSQWDLFTPDGSPFTTEIKTGSLTITSEMIHRVLESSQTLRAWDNVPRRAKAQEIVGNRLIYGNYTQGYNINKTVNLIQEVNSKAVTGKAGKSIKTLRDYKIGMVFGDKYGRETPVLASSYTAVTNSKEDYISTTGDISIPKNLCSFSNSFVVTQTWGDPNTPDEPPTLNNDGWIEYVKYYVKETSNEYYNLVMDRWYPSGDGAFDGTSDSLWLSFNSADRNKVDLDTYLILKNAHGSNAPVLERARYKILAIENEAPDYIKTDFIPIGTIGAPGLTPELTGDTSGNSYEGTWWAENEADTVITEPPIKLSQNNEMHIKTSVWNESGLGFVNANNPTLIFGKDVNMGKVEFRIIGANVVGGVNVGTISTSWKEITHYSFVDETTVGADYIDIKWDKAFSEDEVDMVARFTSLAANNSDFNLNNLQYHVEFRESIIQNKPEFDGKFFVKIQRNSDVDESVVSYNVDSTWNTISTHKLRYIASSSQNEHVMNSGQDNPTTGTTVDYTADFTTSQDWFVGAFDPFIQDGDGNPYWSNDVAFVGTAADYNNHFNVAARNTSFQNYSTADPTSPCDDIVGSGGPCIADMFEEGSPSSMGSALNESKISSPFGSCSENYNNMTRSFWNYFWIDTANDGGTTDVFIDSVSAAFLAITGGKDRVENGGTLYAEDEYINANLGAGAANVAEMQCYQLWGSYASYLGNVCGGPDGVDEGGWYAKPLNVLYPGKALAGGVYGATDGTAGSITLSFVSGGNLDPENYNSGAPIIPQFFAQMTEPGTYFKFQDHPDPDAVFKTLGVMYQSHKPSDPQNHVNRMSYTKNAWKTSYVNNYNDAIAGSFILPSTGQQVGYTTIAEYETLYQYLGDSIGDPPWNTCGKTYALESNWYYPYTDRVTAYIEFRRVDALGSITTLGLDLEEFDPRAFMHHDGRDYINIDIVSIAHSTHSGASEPTEDGAVWETEPKESAADLNLYYEASSAIPMVLTEDNAFDFIPINSKVTASRPSEGNTNVVIGSRARRNPRVNNIHFTNPSSEQAIVSVVSDDVSYQWDETTNTAVESSTFGQSFLHRRDFTVGDQFHFEHPNGLITSAVINELYKPVFIDGSDGFNGITSNDIQYGVVSGPKSFEIAGTNEVWATVTDVSNSGSTENIGAYNIAVTAQVAESITIGDVIVGVTQTINNVDETVNFGTSPGTAPAGVQVISKNTFISSGTNYVVLNFSKPFGSWAWNNLTASLGQSILISFQKNYGYYGVNINVWDQPVQLNWHNCWSFGNGVESDRIRDDFNAPQLDNGVRVSTTFSGYKQETIKSGLIYSGLYNSTSQTNNLNQFNMAEKITKELNPSYGSIQALKTRDTDVVVLAEDKVLKVLANKDALYNADGNPQLTATNRVLGTAVPFAGDYGISKNPESLAWDQYRLYFTDRQRGSVLRLSQDGLTPISNIGMKNWFRNHMKSTNMLLGSFDTVSGEYNLTLKTPSSISHKYKTLSFNEASKGWVSFKSFTPDSGVSYSGNYVTAKNHQIWKHHVNKTLSGQALERNKFYWEDPVDSTIEMIFNDQPNVVKSFKSINYEGSQARITKFTSEEAVSFTGEINYTTQTGSEFLEAVPTSAVTMQMAVNDNQFYNLQDKEGWWVPGMHTDLQRGSVPEFVKKEGKWFNKISGVIESISGDINIDSSEFTVQGLGVVDDVLFTGTIVVTDPCLDINGDEVDCNSHECVTGPCTWEPPACIYGCTNEDAPNYDELATCDDGTCQTNDVQGCMDSSNPAFDPLATVHIQNMCEDVAIGCMDPTASNYNSLATMDGTYFELVNPFLGTTTTQFLQCWNNCSCTYDPDPVFSCPTNETWDPITEQCVSINCPVCDICWDEYGNPIPCDDCTSDNSCGPCDPGFIWQGSASQGGCVPQVYGCMDVYALNYQGPALEFQWPNDVASGQPNINGVTYNGLNPATGLADAQYATANTACYELQSQGVQTMFGGDINIITNSCCIYGEQPTLPGCMDPDACNFCGIGNSNYIYPFCTDGPTNPEENENMDMGMAGLCNYDCTGCMDYNAFNFCAPCQNPCYDDLGVENGYDGGCCIPFLSGAGCTDPQAGNFCETCAVDDGSCVYYIANDNCADNPCQGEECYGCTDPIAGNYCECCTINAVSSTDFTTVPCNYYWGNIYGCTDSDAWNYDATATSDDGSCIPVMEGCMEEGMVNYSEIYNTPCDDCCEASNVGCTDSTMWNFDPYANDSTGNPCINIIYGCTTIGATNYNPNAHTNYVSVFDDDCWDDCQGQPYVSDCLETCWTHSNVPVVPCTFADEGPFEVINYPDDSEGTVVSGTNDWLYDLPSDAYDDPIDQVQE